MIRYISETPVSRKMFKFYFFLNCKKSSWTFRIHLRFQSETLSSGGFRRHLSWAPLP